MINGSWGVILFCLSSHSSLIFKSTLFVNNKRRSCRFKSIFNEKLVQTLVIHHFLSSLTTDSVDEVMKSDVIEGAFLTLTWEWHPHRQDSWPWPFMSCPLELEEEDGEGEEIEWPTSEGPASFLNFTLRFWNQILTCFSLNWSVFAISILLSRERYMFLANSFSRWTIWVDVKAVRSLDFRSSGESQFLFSSLVCPVPSSLLLLGLYGEKLDSSRSEGVKMGPWIGV